MNIKAITLADLKNKKLKIRDGEIAHILKTRLTKSISKDTFEKTNVTKRK